MSSLLRVGEHHPPCFPPCVLKQEALWGEWFGIYCFPRPFMDFHVWGGDWEGARLS